MLYSQSTLHVWGGYAVFIIQMSGSSCFKHRTCSAVCSVELQKMWKICMTKLKMGQTAWIVLALSVFFLLFCYSNPHRLCQMLHFARKLFQTLLAV